jgi:hypothetical protein
MSLISTPVYTDYDFEMIPIYNKYIEDVVNESDLPTILKRRMLRHRCILKDKQGYYLLAKERIYFLPFRQWLLQTERHKKLEQLLSEK